MTISIIIPTLNEVASVARAIDNALAGGAHEVIVVDGGSDDGTRKVVDDKGCRLLECAPGRAAQQNLGARQASGEVLMFLHADNWLEPRGLRQIEEALADGDVLGGAFRQQIEAPGRMYRLLERGNAFRARRLRLPYGDQGIFMRREVFERLGGFPEVPIMEDLLLMRRFRRLARPVLLPGPLHVNPRRWQRHGVVGQTARNWLLLSATLLGVSPRRLAAFYPPHR